MCKHFFKSSYSACPLEQLSVAFTKIAEKRLWASSCMSVCSSDRMAQIGSHWADLHEVWYSNFLFILCNDQRMHN